MRLPFLNDGDARLYVGDCIEVMAEMDAESVDAVVCDPPYGLEFMGKAWDRYAPPEFAAWCETWAREALRVLKPGGHLLAFGGTRTYHRLTCGIEDAGFQVRDCLSWLYGSGFPKSLNLDGEWQGWGTALKPGWEPCVVARKPLTGTVAENVQAHGTGAINVDGCRIPHASEADLAQHAAGVAAIKARGGSMANSWKNSSDLSGANDVKPGGRWPANVVLDEQAAAMLDAQSGDITTTRIEKPSKVQEGKGWSRTLEDRGARGYTDNGGASRFFYTAKASRSDRSTNGANNTHPTVKPTDLMRWLVRLVTPPGGVVLDPFAGSGTTLVAARAEGVRCIGIEREDEYAQIVAARLSQLSLLSDDHAA